MFFSFPFLFSNRIYCIGAGYWLFGGSKSDQNTRSDETNYQNSNNKENGWTYHSSHSKKKNDKSWSEKLFNTMNPCTYYECCGPNHIVYDIDGLKMDLQKKLFGQHIVNATLIPILRAHVKNLEKSEKPLVMSFHGNMGTGKNHVADLIIKHFFKNGNKSKFVHKYYARKDFTRNSSDDVSKYRVSVKHSLIFSFFLSCISLPINPANIQIFKH